jgi:tetratricopeptide (TPR) repeat protein
VRTRYASWLLEPYLRLDEAREQLDLAIQCDPLSAMVRGCLGHHLIFRREFRQASAELELAVGLEPAYWWAQMYLAGAYAFQGMFDRAGVILEKLLAADTENRLVLGSLAFGCGAAGRRDLADGFHRQLLGSTRFHPRPLTVA